MTNYCEQCLTHPCICKRPETREFSGGGKRDAESIPGFSMVPRGPLARLASRYEHGEVKYGRHNWRGGLPAAECLDRAIEHIYQHIEGDGTEDHLAAAVFNLFCVMEFEVTRPDLINYRVKCQKVAPGSVNLFDPTTGEITKLK